MKTIANSGLRLRLYQMDVEQGAVDINLHHIRKTAEGAAREGVSILCLPELCTTGFNWAHNEANGAAASASLGVLQAIARENGIALYGSVYQPGHGGNRGNNTAFWIATDGTLAANYFKVHLFGLFDEPKHLQGGEDVVFVETAVGLSQLAICYDLRFPELFRAGVPKRASACFLTAAWPLSRLEHWRSLIRARAIENQLWMVAVNQCGVEGPRGGVGERRYAGHSMVVDPWGEVLLELGETEATGDFVIDGSAVDDARKRMPALEDRRVDLYRRWL